MERILSATEEWFMPARQLQVARIAGDLAQFFMAVSDPVGPLPSYCGYPRT